MWLKLLRLALANPRVRKILTATAISAAFVAFVFVYAILSAPWTILSGQFDKLFSSSDPNSLDISSNTKFEENAFAALTKKEYLRNFQQYLDNFRNALNPPYRNEWGATYDPTEERAKEEAEKIKERCLENEDLCSISTKFNTVIYSTFGSKHMYGQEGNDKDEANNPLTENVFVNRKSEAESGIKGGIDEIRINDAAATLCVYDNVGLMWNCYSGQHPENKETCEKCSSIPNDIRQQLKKVIEEMEVPKDPSSGKYMGSLATVDCSEVVTLIKKNAHLFFQGHVPDSSGLCFPNKEAIYMEVPEDKLPRSFEDLHTIVIGTDDKGNELHYPEPFGGIYYSISKTECNCNDDDDPDNDHGFPHYDYFVEVTAVGYVEYKGYSWFESHLGIDYFPKSRGYIDEAYRNLIDIVGGQELANDKLAGHSMGLDPLFKADAEDKDRNPQGRDYGFGGEIGTLFPVVDASGKPYRISAGFHDPNYVADLTHWGVDFAAPLQTPIRATTDGEVVKIGFDADGFGNYAAIYQGKNEKGDRYYCIYAHMFSPPSVRPGSTVSAGENIGLVGSTGFSTGPHLHYEIRVVRADGTIQSIDPFSAEGGLRN